ncbi:MAG: class I SAM-dependent methyltransferase [Eubacterium sp.]|nr:class I SAM-dependent methyltransferase [Eubacterium sp.]
MTTSDQTLDYYDRNTAAYVQSTVGVDFHVLRGYFLKYIPSGGTILDLGCGSGRDSKAFLDAGYQVISVDGSEKMCRAAERLIEQPVLNCRFQDYLPEKQLDGIWACASLLHISVEEIHTVIKRLTPFLKSKACFYMSFKYGSFTGIRDGRYYSDLTPQAFREKILYDIPELASSEEFVTHDVRAGRKAEQWLNEYLIRKP